MLPVVFIVFHVFFVSNQFWFLTGFIFLFESELINDLTGLNAVQVTLNRRVCQLYQCKCIVNRSYSKDQRLYNFEFKTIYLIAN